ncbi:MAG: RNA methyltransferase [Bacteroidia bacterium]|nr:RNA methyltransferase [Bacteroidia bacterium]
MLSKNQASFIRSLQQKKFRDEHRCFVAEGEKMVHDLLSSGIGVKEIYSSVNFQHSLFSHDTAVIRITAREMGRISSLHTPSGVLAVCSIPEHRLDTTALSGKLTIALDDIRDPGNLGTLLRIADWFGVEHVICSQETVDLYNPKAVQATMGSIARVKLHYRNLLEFIPALPADVVVAGTFMEGESVYTADLPASALLLIGNEGKGISEAVCTHITRRLSIPSFAHLHPGSSGAESLNAAVAAGILCSEFRRRPA